MDNISKNPITMLVELECWRKRSYPQFKLVNADVKSKTPEFTYEVIIENILAHGSGKSKKEAKHNAAYNILTKLNDMGVYDINCSCIQNVTKLSCIATLTDICNQNKFPQPIFTEISRFGPKCNLEYTYDCQLSSFRTLGTANSKKQARHLAAKKMIDRIQDMVDDLRQAYDDSYEALGNSSAGEVYKYDEVSKLVKPNFSVKVSKYCDSLFELMKKVLVEPGTLSKYFSEPQTLATLTSLLTELDLKCAIEILQTDPFIVCLNINLDTPFSTVGMGKSAEEAVGRALNASFDMIETFINYTC